MADNVVDCTHPDLQDWVLALQSGGSVRAYICDENASEIAQGDMSITSQAGGGLLAALSEAQSALKELQQTPSFNDAGQQFYRDYPEPTWDMELKLKRSPWWKIWK